MPVAGEGCGWEAVVSTEADAALSDDLVFATVLGVELPLVIGLVAAVALSVAAAAVGGEKVPGVVAEARYLSQSAELPPALVYLSRENCAS